MSHLDHSISHLYTNIHIRSQHSTQAAQPIGCSGILEKNVRTGFPKLFSCGGSGLLGKRGIFFLVAVRGFRNK